MRIFTLCSWFDEGPEHLTRLIGSLRGFCDVFVALDGSYATWPVPSAQSPSEQRFALQDAVRDSGMSYRLTAPWRPWASEVEKRAALFELGRQAGATPEDWFLIMDADMALGEYSQETRAKLEASSADVAEVRWHNIMTDGGIGGMYRFRSMFRALPGLTVERAHYLYTVPYQPGRRFLWHLPNGQLADEPICDLYGDITLQHFNSSREPDRKQRALDYYKHRDANGLEAVGDWR